MTKTLYRDSEGLILNIENKFQNNCTLSILLKQKNIEVKKINSFGIFVNSNKEDKFYLYVEMTGKRHFNTYLDTLNENCKLN